VLGIFVAIEVVVWIADAWATTGFTDTWLTTIPVPAILVALPGVFSKTGDKRHVVVAVPVRTRLLI
jgi:hypothetical protein